MAVKAAQKFFSEDKDRVFESRVSLLFRLPESQLELSELITCPDDG